MDDCWRSIGSADLDNRLLSLNKEANLSVLDEKAIAAHQLLEEEKSHSCEKIRGRVGLMLASQM